MAATRSKDVTREDMLRLRSSKRPMGLAGVFVFALTAALLSAGPLATHSPGDEAGRHLPRRCS